MSRYVCLDNLPTHNTGTNRGKINWQKCIGLFIPFVYDDIKGSLHVKDKIGETLNIEYDGQTLNIIIGNLKKCRLGKLLNRYTNDFKISIGYIFEDSNRNIVVTEKRYISDLEGKSRKWYKYTCNVCGWTEGWMEESHIIKGIGCSCCANRTAVLGINTIWDTDRWLVDLGVGEEDAKQYTKCSGKKIEVTCPLCSKEKIIPISKVYTRKSIGCTCGDGFSYPEKFMTNILMQIGVKFETQYSPDYLGSKRSDFYLPEHNLIIEMDGGLGHKDGKSHAKSNLTIEEHIEVDNWKDEQHRLHGIETIRINCFESDMEYIKNNILRGKIADVLDLNIVNWDKVGIYAIMSNKVKEVCEVWNDRGSDCSVNLITSIVGISDTTVKSYLKKGTKLGWCNYNPEEEKIKNYQNTKIGDISRKPIEVFKDGLSLGVFESATEIERQSEELFGVKLYQSSISRVCLGKSDFYKKYKFEFI